MFSSPVVPVLTLSCSLLMGAFYSGFPSTTSVAVESIQLVEVHEDLRAFEDQERYDYLDDDFEYSVIGDTEFDEVFYQSALLAGRMFQIRETSRRYREGQLDRERSDDADFLLLMSMEATASLPTLVSEAQDLSGQIADLDPKRLGRFQKIRAVRGLNRARKNIQMILDTRDDIDAILNDFKTLQGDLETVEDEDTEGDS